MTPKTLNRTGKFYKQHQRITEEKKAMAYPYLNHRKVKQSYRTLETLPFERKRKKKVGLEGYVL